MKLYEITNEFKYFFENLNDDENLNETGELTSETLQKMESLIGDFQAKAIAVATYIKNLEAEEEVITNAIKQMNIRKARLKRQADSLSNYLQSNLETMNIPEIKTCPYFKIKLKKCPASVEIINEFDIPADYWKETISTTLDKLKIKEEIQSGKEIPGVQLTNRIKLEIK